MDFLSRKSTIAFLLICIIGVFGPFVLKSRPSDIVGAPFSRPVWWNIRLSETREYSVKSERLCLSWGTNPPALFQLQGDITAEKPVKIIWERPNDSNGLQIAELKDMKKYQVNIDARDMIFKQKLGFSPVGNATGSLFPKSGNYYLSIEGAEKINLDLKLPGNRQGMLGTDQRGRDTFTMFIYGIRTSLLIGIIATLIGCLLGLSFGLMAGYIGGWTDTLIMRSVDVLMSIPTMPILIILAGVWGKGLWQIIFTLSMFSWMGTARSVRSLVLSIRENPWVESLKTIGAKKSYILIRHFIPETTPVMFANLAMGVPGAILSEATLAFFGLSDPRLISWGRMLHEAHSFGAFTEGAWWLLLPPGIGIVVICLIFMDMGRYLEEKIDPRISGKK